MDTVELISKLESMHKKAAETIAHQNTYYTGVMDTLRLLIEELKTKIEQEQENEKTN